MKKRILGLAALLGITLASLSPAHAAAMPASEVLPIWPGAAPGTADWTGPEVFSSMIGPAKTRIEMVTNVTVPTLTVFRPAAGTANGTAMIVAPGGGFEGLAIEHEGRDVAQWLAERGVTAFVLKYRVRPWPLRVPAASLKQPAWFDAFALQLEPKRQLAVIDGIQAMHYLRANAAKLGIQPDRIGFMGFSGGAMTTMGVILDGPPADRPNFAAPIYGAMEGLPVPGDAPPLFIAAAQDDPLIPASKSVAMFSAWTAAGRPAELHIYEHGSHGFGAIRLGKPVDGWLPALGAWLTDHGWLAR